ncbi:PREDICTED: homeobox protein MSX-1-like [Pseudopodoces humilis]|uniref:homeobox protein MSX-1-like n=1 Tax=Pseudopodoces humilis TaxID=181119 RepID=UPI0003958796|nr:PREDICTED: homeobox protein MSX-1-like [Pseudopodoces humilis]
MLGAGGPGPAVSAHLATLPYVPYPGSARYGDYYWFSAGSTDSVPTEEAPAPDALPLPAAKTPSPSGMRAIGLPGAGSGPGGLGGDARCCGRPRRGCGGRGSVGGQGLREPAWPLCPYGTGQRGEQRRLGSAATKRPRPTSPRCAAHGCGAPASPQGTRDLKLSREAGFYRFLSLPCLILLTALLFSSVDSPASSTSGTLTQYYTPDSATSPTAAGTTSPHSSLQKVKAHGKGVVKTGKSRTAFSQEQLKALHQRFQSQKYLSPQQIRELAAALELTYKQVKTWFQNQRMKFKRCQKESQWMDNGLYLPQNGVHQAAYLDVAPAFHQVFPVGAGGNFQAVPSVHHAYSSGQTYGNGQNLYSFVSVEDEGFCGKGGSSCNSQQTMGLLSQQMNLYHSYFDNTDVSVDAEDTFNFQSTSDTVTPFSSFTQNQCQLPWHPMGTQSGYESQV